MIRAETADLTPSRLTCLGPPDLVGPDGQQLRAGTRKQLGLLAYLAIETHGWHSRDHLATLLWPTTNIRDARHSLATAMSQIRQSLEMEFIETRLDSLRMIPGAVTTDVAALLAQDEFELDTITAAVFLDGFEVPDAPEFNHWIERQRARLQPHLHKHFEWRIEQCRRTGNMRAMANCAEQLRRINPLSEVAMRAILEVRAMVNDRLGALREYENWRERLSHELGAIPSREVEEIADRLRRRRSGGTTATTWAPVPTEQWQERSFVGRAQEFETCYSRWVAARAGTPGSVLLIGESGIGKSTLAGRVATTAALEGASVARVQCHELERELPFGVVGHLVARLVDLPGAGATPPMQLAELAQLVAVVGQRWPGLPEPPQFRGEAARIQFTEALLGLIMAVADEHPVVLVIDDVHLSDFISMAVLHMILRRLDGMPVMAMLTMPSSGESIPDQAARFARRDSTLPMTVLAVPPLPEVHQNELLDELLRSHEEPGPTVRRALLSGARGNPMVLELLVGDWLRRGHQSMALTSGSMSEAGSSLGASDLRSLISQTLGSLDAEARAVVDLGAVLGTRLNDLGMYTLVDLPVVRTMRAMTSLTSQRILRDAGSHLEFANAAIRHDCYQAMAAPLRRQLHSLVGDRLLVELESGEPIPGLELAWHLVRAGRLEEGVPYLLQGGQESIRRGAPHEVDLALRTGLPVLSGQARSTGILILAEALQDLGQWQESLGTLELPADPDDASEESWRKVLQAVGRRWLGNQTQGELREASDVLLEIAASDVAPNIRARALGMLPYLLTQTRDDQTLARMGTLVQHIDPNGLDPYDHIHLLLARAWWYERNNQFDSAAGCITIAQQLVADNEYGGSLALRICIGDGMVNLVRGNYADAVAPLEKAFAIARSIDNRTHQATASASLAIVNGRLGNTAEQVEWSRLALSHLSETDFSMVALAATYEHALGLCFSRHSPAAIDVADSFATRCNSDTPDWARQTAFLMQADIYSLAGATRKAYQFGKKALAISPDRPLLNDMAGLHARWTALVGMKTGDIERSEASITTRLSNSDDWHAKDIADALAAKATLEECLGRDSTDTRSALAERLDSLPKMVRVILHQMGMLETKRSALRRRRSR